MAQAVDIHHLENKGLGGVKNHRLNRIDNLFPVCRKCHDKAHADKSINKKWKQVLLDRIEAKEFMDKI